MIQFVADKELQDMLQRLKGLTAHKNYEGRYDLLFKELARIGLKQLDPMEKSNKSKTDINNKSETGISNRINNGKSKGETNRIKSVNEINNIKLTREFNNIKLTDEINNIKTNLQTNDSCDTKFRNAPLPMAPNVIQHNRYIPRALKIRIWHKAKGKCQFVDLKTKTRCESNHALEFDHIVPVARGGTTTENNLNLLCDQHNRLKGSNYKDQKLVTATPE